MRNRRGCRNKDLLFLFKPHFPLSLAINFMDGDFSKIKVIEWYNVRIGLSFGRF